MSRLAFCLCGGLPFAHVLASAPKCSQLLPKCFQVPKSQRP
jgi:hypothetical protein